MVNFIDTTPIYLQIVEHVKSEICIGRLPPGEKLPSIRELSEKLKVNPNTVSRAYQELEREGVSEAQRGLGVYVTSNKERISLMQNELSQKYISLFLSSMLQIGIRGEDVLKVLSQFIENSKEDN